MIQKITAEERFTAQNDWLSTYHLFSFAEYYDENNMNFGDLRVFNDDTIAGGSGFGSHGHNDMEIITVVLEGELTHKDNMGNARSIKKGEVQYMSAGTGVIHSEMNLGKSAVHLYQIWLLPKQKNLEPTYSQKDFSQSFKRNILLPVASSNAIGEVLVIQADATIYTSILEAGQSVNYRIEKNRGLFIYTQHGILRINDIIFHSQSQARIKDEEEVIIIAEEEAAFIMIDITM